MSQCFVGGELRKDLDATPANSIARSAFDIPPTAPWRDAKMR